MLQLNTHVSQAVSALGAVRWHERFNSAGAAGTDVGGSVDCVLPAGRQRVMRHMQSFK